MKDGTVTDLRRGIYRRLYAGFVKGRRINKLSLSAEAWFWRVLASVDDFGNADAEPGLCYAATVGRRPGITLENVSEWLMELEKSGLIQMYLSPDGDKYLHIVGFEEMQPAGRNGKRVCRFPRPDESGGIQNNPGEPCASMSEHSHSHSEKQGQVHPDESRGYPFDHFAVLAYEQTLKPDPGLAIRPAEMIADTVVDTPDSRAVWTDVLRLFTGNDYNPRHAGNALDRYSKEMAKVASGERAAPVVKLSVAERERKESELRERMTGHARTA